MNGKSLKLRIFISFMAVVLTLSSLIALLGFSVIKRDIIDRTQREVTRNIASARSFYASEIENIGWLLRLVEYNGDIETLKKKLRLDYAVKVDVPAEVEIKSNIARMAVEKKAGIGGTRIIAADELQEIDTNLYRERAIAIKPTPKARPTERQTLDMVMAKEYAIPSIDAKGNVTSVIYGGRIVNLDYKLVDRIRTLVFGNELYNSKPVGTVTIFQDDIRIATNVLDEQGNRAVGTRVSDEVYHAVIEQGKLWHDRAFVVTDWYMTAYEPIHDIEGNTIGMLYVGVLEQPFSDMAKRVILVFLIIVAGATLLALALSLIVTFRITRPLIDVAEAAQKLAQGQLGYEVNNHTKITELDTLAVAFNDMSGRLKERDESLRVTNEKLIVLNKSYIDLIGFVAHELKGILASAVMNAYAVRDGYLGLVNFKQRKALDSITRNLDYLTVTVRKFLNLGRIEKSELVVNKTMLNIKRDIFDISIDALRPLAVGRKIRIKEDIDPQLEINADSDLMLIVANNLISNAIKYGIDGGRLEIKVTPDNGKLLVEVYNDSEPITEEQKDKLFKKFSRLDVPAASKVKGTGLGLYITKQVIEKHGGRIWIEPREAGNSFIFEIERN
ncbi:MAG: cache domain-containing protein [Phycisphaerae bacterium]|nr:cache domain-containing protein [Phycisphaerae bacterium]